MNKQEITQFIKQRSLELGFTGCGIAQSVYLNDDAIRLESWLKQNHHGSMDYMQRNFDVRVDPSKLVHNAKSVISLTYNYYSTQQQEDKTAPKISKYAYGEDYHHVIKEKLVGLLNELQSKVGQFNGRFFVDSAPILERTWAVKSGLGWIGKNGNLISKSNGSFFFLCEIVVDIELDYDVAFSTNHCGKCNACIEACPTEAILPNKVVDGGKCISYLTIELKDEIPSSFKGKLDNWMFGCDVCQDVCPWNRFSKQNGEPKFTPNSEMLEMKAADWTEITEDIFKRIFKNSAVKRTKYNGLSRNIVFLKSGIDSKS